MALIMAGQRAALGQFLAFTRTQEASADQAGAKYLHDAGISGQGLLEFFGKLQNQEYRLAIYAKDSYDRTHPLSTRAHPGARTVAAQGSPPGTSRPIPRSMRASSGSRPSCSASRPASARSSKYPESDQSVPAHYARAYAYHLGSYPDKALSETEALLADRPRRSLLPRTEGPDPARIAASPRRRSRRCAKRSSESGDAPLISAMLGHALVATEDPKNFAEAKPVLKRAVNRDNENPFAWFQLGIIYDREGDPARASLASAERFSLEGKPMLALTKARIALAAIAPGTPTAFAPRTSPWPPRPQLERELKDKTMKTSTCAEPRKRSRSPITARLPRHLSAMPETASGRPR